MPVPRVLHLGGADGPLGVAFYVMERVLGHVCRNALPPGYADAPEPRAAIGAALVDVLADLHAVDPAAVGLDGFGRPGRLRRAPAAPLVAAVGAPRRPASCPRSTSCATSSCATLPPQRARGDRPRRLPARQHDPAPDAARPHRRRPRLGDEHARRPAHRPRHAARLLERGRPTTTSLAAARVMAPVTAAEGFPTRAEIVERYARADGLRRLRRRVVPGVRVLQARRRLPGHRGARRRRRDARLRLRRRAAARGAARRGRPAAARHRLSASAFSAPGARWRAAG